MRIKAIVFLILTCAIGNALAFDGQRKGFILGVGIGAAYSYLHNNIEYNDIYIDTEGSWREEGLGTQYEIKIGYALNDHFLLSVVARDITFVYEDHPYDRFYLQKDLFTHTYGLIGIGISAYAEEKTPSPYITVNVFYPFSNSSFIYPDLSHNDGQSGIGLSFAVGYEFVPHWSVELSVTGADVYETNPPAISYVDRSVIQYSSIALTINALGY